MGSVGLEPTHLAVPDFESGASTNSTKIPVFDNESTQPDLNRRPEGYESSALTRLSYRW